MFTFSNITFFPFPSCKLTNREHEREVERKLTGGVTFYRELRPYRIEGYDDKVILPEESLKALTEEDAFVGAMLFNIQCNGKASHCGVREFSAKEGTIGLPPKILDTMKCKEYSDLELHSLTVLIKYVRLSKCTFIKLQPKLNRFFEVGPVKQTLEDNLRFHSTMTVGDELTIWYVMQSRLLCSLFLFVTLIFFLI